MFCSNCGKQASESDQFCRYCGYQLVETPNPAAETPSPEPSPPKKKSGSWVMTAVIIGIIAVFLAGAAYLTLRSGEKQPDTVQETGAEEIKQEPMSEEDQLRELLTENDWWFAWQDISAVRFQEDGTWYSLDYEYPSEIGSVEVGIIPEEDGTIDREYGYYGTYEISGKTLKLYQEDYGDRVLQYREVPDDMRGWFGNFDYFDEKVFYEEEYDPGEYGENSPIMIYRYGAQQESFDANASREEVLSHALEHALVCYEESEYVREVGMSFEDYVYYLCDMDGDGADELVLEMPLSRRNSAFHVIDVQNNRAVEAGTTELMAFGSMVSCEDGGFYIECSTGDGIVVTGPPKIHWVRIENSELIDTELSGDYNEETLAGYDSIPWHRVEDYYAANSLY
ncbi:MAG: zinc-ribbon domain-containing protein [Clostridiales bacterium]|nr:zinc-ribbon domain-containing protein [Clostridiales bacterium]